MAIFRWIPPIKMAIFRLWLWVYHKKAMVRTSHPALTDPELHCCHRHTLDPPKSQRIHQFAMLRRPPCLPRSAGRDGAHFGLVDYLHPNPVNLGNFQWKPRDLQNQSHLRSFSMAKQMVMILCHVEFLSFQFTPEMGIVTILGYVWVECTHNIGTFVYEYTPCLNIYIILLYIYIKIYIMSLCMNITLFKYTLYYCVYIYIYHTQDSPNYETLQFCRNMIFPLRKPMVWGDYAKL